MARTMDQHLFDSSVLLIASERAINPSTYTDYLKSYKEIVSAYKDIYSEDPLFRVQLIESVEGVVKRYRATTSSRLHEAIKAAVDVRMMLDEDMRPHSGIKKLFKGVVFQKNHPNPLLRATISINNCCQIIDIALSNNLV
jgi:hypothetical protein